MIGLLGKLQDLTGMRFGRLKVIERGDDYISPGGHREVRWWCKCECKEDNDLKLVTGSNLKAGHVRSCGCFAIETFIRNGKIAKRYNTYDLTGDYGVGYTLKEEPFYFDLDDYDKIKYHCWSINPNGYVTTSLYEDKIVLLMHRLVMNCPDDMEVDHKFQNRFDNRKEFLRIVTPSQNGMNSGLQSNNTSGITGVHWNKRRDKWRAQIQLNGETINLGDYINFDEAVEVRKQAELKYFGEYRYKGNKKLG